MSRSRSRSCPLRLGSVLVALVATGVVAACGDRGSTPARPDATTATESSWTPEAGFHTTPWLRGWLAADGTVLTIEYGITPCYRTEHRVSAYVDGDTVAVRLESRALEEPPITCLPYGVPPTRTAVVLPRPASADEIVDGHCIVPIGPVMVTMLEPPGYSVYEPPPTQPGDCQRRPIVVGEPDGPVTPDTTLPPID